MALKPFSVVGEALHFSTRRFETIMRVAALPLSLLLIFNMAATFGYLSIANNRIITFSDVSAAGASWAQAARLANRAAQSGLAAASPEAWTIYGASLIINAILIASFMAPLVRYAGLGERPAPGLLRIPFGLDHIRFLLAGALSALLFALVVYAPISFATISIAAFITGAMKTPYAAFPDTQSLHTIDIIAGAEAFGVRWFHQYQVWGAWAALAAAIVIALLILHLRPRRDDNNAGAGFFRRSLGVVTGVAAYLTICAFVYVLLMRVVGGMLASSGAPPIAGAMSADALGAAVFIAALIAFAGFFSIQLFPYAGIATCQRSMAFTGTLRVTRRYNLFRLALAFVMLGVILFGAELLLVWLGGGGAYAVLGYLAALVRSYVRLLNGGEGGDWVFPFFGWVWAVIGVVFTLLWTAFTYGVTAGLFGRLYRESLKA